MKNYLVSGLKIGFGLIVSVLVIGFSLLMYELGQYWNEAPSEQKVLEHYEQLQSNRFVKTDELPDHMIDALHAAYDSSYLVDGVPWMNCLWLLTNGNLKGNCSTDIPMHAAKIMNAEMSVPGILPPIENLVHAWKLENTLTRRQIVHLVLNRAYFGKGAYGVSDAADIHLSKSAANLSVSEAALLMGMLEAPSRYDPIRNPEGTKQRRNTILNKMHVRGYMSNADFEEYQQAPLMQ